MPAGLVWVSDAEPGYRRVKRGDRFDYLDTAGKRIRDEAVLARIRKLAIPPAYERRLDLPDAERPPAGDRARRARPQAVPLPPAVAQQRDDDKFERMLDVRRRAAAHPRARAARPEGRDGRRPRAEVLATVVRLLDTTLIRVGNEEYARGNGSFGLTTLRNRHAGVTGASCGCRSAARAACGTR